MQKDLRNLLTLTGLKIVECQTLRHAFTSPMGCTCLPVASFSTGPFVYNRQGASSCWTQMGCLSFTPQIPLPSGMTDEGPGGGILLHV